MSAGQHPQTIWTVGHSTLTLKAFIAILREHKIEALADVRLLPGSKRYPHFNGETLADELGKAGITYVHLTELGGRRRPRADSPNVAWRNENFRGYADHMETDEFRRGLDKLRQIAMQRRTAMMCAEAVWWKCHRSLVADLLKVQGVEVLHILGESKVEPHPFTSAARVVGGKLSYRGEHAELPLA
jgi:uncharacterized protein (DUF488 family)